jgi:hypothetical protein
MWRSAVLRWSGLGLLVLGAVAAARSARAADVPTFTVTAVSAYLRDTPSTQAVATYSVFQGQVYPIIGRRDDNAWLQLDYPRATKGAWILANLGKVTGDLGTVPITAGQGAVTPTPLARATPSLNTPPPTLTPSGPNEICALLFDDVNGNGKLEAHEGGIAGGQLTLMNTQSGAVLQSVVIGAGDGGSHCFGGLADGTYTVAAAAPPGYNATTQTSLLQPVSGGQRYDITFGAQPGAAVPVPGGQFNYWVGLVVFVLVAAIAAAYLLMRRR